MDRRRTGLTEREISIVQLTAAGESAKEAAFKLDIAPRTVEKHLDNSRLKMGARNTPHLIAICIATGLVEPAVDCAA